MIPRDIERWSKADWDRNVYYCMPSGGGAVGVLFVWTRRANFNDPRTSDFVIKPIQGTAGPTKFAEMMLKKVAHANSPNSKAITKLNPPGIALLQTLKQYRDRETNAKSQARWKAVWQHYYNAQTFLIQELQSDMQELGDVYREEGGLAAFLNNETLMMNLGRLFAADALIGNGDRLCEVNTGNILFKKDGTFCAIDSAAILTAYTGVLKQSVDDFNEVVSSLKIKGGTPEQRLPYQDKARRDHYVKKFIHAERGEMLRSPAQEREYAKGRAGVLPPAFHMEKIFDVRVWWETKFKTHFAGTVDVVAMASTFNAAFEAFKRGFDAGVRDIDTRLSGVNWLLLKAECKKLARQYGIDPNLNLDNLKLRRQYFRQLRSGATAATALVAVQRYALANMPAL